MERKISDSLLSVFSRLAKKLRRDGPAGLVKTLLRPLAGESIGRAIAGHRQITAQLNQPSTRALNRKFHPARKYLSPYLGKHFGKVQRREILLHHYRFLAAEAPPDFHDKLVPAPYILWQEMGGQEVLAIAVTPNPRYEGELTLVFLAAGISVFELSFTIAPGSVAGSEHKNVLLIGRIQGGRRNDLIKIAARSCRHISPKYLLMAAAQSVASLLGAGAVMGASNEEQVSGSDDPYYLANYDEFWETLHAVKTQKGFYELPIPFPQKPLSEVPMSHRRNTKLKRQFKDDVGNAVARTLAMELLKRDMPVAEAQATE